MFEIQIYIKTLKKDPLFPSYVGVLKELLRQFYSANNLDLNIFLKQIHFFLPQAFLFLKRNRVLLKENKVELINLKKKNIEVLAYGDPLFPELYYQMEDPPLILYYWGYPAWLTQRTISVVGSRNPHQLSLDWIENDLQQAIVSEQWVTVSGGARGIDQKVHSISIRNQLPTIAVLPSGLANIYPADLHQLAFLIRDNGGCLLTEYDYHQTMKKYLFAQRNRLIVGLAKATCIVEAMQRGGTYLSAQLAANMGRDLYVLPSHPGLIGFAGNLDLIREGATPICNSEDLIAFYNVNSNC